MNNLEGEIENLRALLNKAYKEEGNVVSSRVLSLSQMLDDLINQWNEEEKDVCHSEMRKSKGL